MELKGERLIPAKPDTTWAALNDPDTLKACIAGCESLERTADDAFAAVVAVAPASAAAVTFARLARRPAAVAAALGGLMFARRALAAAGAALPPNGRPFGRRDPTGRPGGLEFE